MFHIMQKHRRIMMVFIFVFIGIPLAIWVPGASNSDNSQGKGFPVLNVNGTDVYAYEFLQVYNQQVNTLNAQEQPAEAADLVANGTVDRIISSLVQRTVLNSKAAENAVLPEKQYIAAKLKDNEVFKNEDGIFMANQYNAWVKGNDDAGMDWEEFYDNYAVDISRENFTKLIQASARISESEMREQYLKSQRKIKVKYLSIDPPVELTEEEIVAQHTNNPDLYMSQPENTVEYVSFSAVPPLPETITAVVAKARAGEDFVALAKEHSVGADKESGGDMGWVPISDLPIGPEQHYMGLKAGEVSDAVRFASDVHVYKVSEERVNPETQAAEIKVNRIVFRPAVTPEFHASVEAAAQALLDAVNANDNDLRAAATAAGLTVQTTPPFANFAQDIEGISTNDLRSFSQGFGALALDEVNEEIVEGRDNIYVGKVIAVKEPAPQALADVREAVERDALAAKKQTPEYLETLNGYIEKINAEAKSLEDIVTMFPELTFEIKETSKAFGPRDFLFQEGIFWNTGQVFQDLSDKEAGAILAPVVDFQGANFVLELTGVEEPEAEAFEADWAEQKETVIDNVRTQAKFARQADYMKFLADKATSGGKVMRYNDIIFEVIGLTSADPADEVTGDESVEEVTDGDVPADAVSTEEAPAETPAEEPAN